LTLRIAVLPVLDSMDAMLPAYLPDRIMTVSGASGIASFAYPLSSGAFSGVLGSAVTHVSLLLMLSHGTLPVSVPSIKSFTD